MNIPSKNYTLRRYQRGDEHQIIDLLTMAFDDWKLREDRVQDYWNWLYTSNPTTFNVIQVGVSDKKIIATDHGLSLIAKIGDEIVNCHYGTDLVVHPDFRRRGISDEFRENKKKIFLQQEIKFNYTYAVNPIIVRVHSTRHNTLPFRLSRYLRIEKTRLHLKMKKTKNHWQTFLLFQSLKLINKIRIRLSPSQEKNEDFTIKEIKQFDQRIDEFSRKISEHNKFIIVRDRKYLNWRFSDPRAGNYTIYQAENNEQVLGYIVLTQREMTPSYPEGHILDLLTLPGRTDVADNLLKKTIKHFELKKYNVIVNHIVENHPQEKILKENGFINSRSKIHLFYYDIGNYNLKEEIINLSDANTHLSYSDLYLL